MNKDDIIRMAREAGFNPGNYMAGNLQIFKRFAAIVAAEKEKQMVDILERLQERSNGSHNYYGHAIRVIKGEI